ncbi:MAG: hypothetical protein M1814_003708 [Vezdaea aestivalis]|nr:MAG: hypothetical protein M1814_003708 [Vezdaea aestivalis]
MPAPSPLAISISVLNRLTKEEKSYHKELSQQEARLAKPDLTDPENAEFQAKQEAKAIEQTKAVIVDMQKKIDGAALKVESMLGEKGNDPAEEEKARTALAEARTNA